jgi:hypothetical protein
MFRLAGAAMAASLLGVLGLLITPAWLSAADEPGVLRFKCVGFAPPVDAGEALPIARQGALRLNANLFDQYGIEVTPAYQYPTGEKLSAAPVRRVLYRSGDQKDWIDVTEYVLPSGAALEANQFKYGSFFARSNQWHYTLGTANLSALGTYRVDMVSGDKDAYVIDPPCQAALMLGP